MKNTRKAITALAASLLLAAMLGLAACGGSSTSGSAASSGSGSAASAASGSAASAEASGSAAGPQSTFTDEEMAVYNQANNGDGIVNTFIGEKFCDHKVTDEKSAKDCVMEVIDRIGGDSTTELVVESIRPNQDGMTVVTFSQRAGELMVYGATVKLIVDKDDQAIGLVSSIMPDANIRDIAEWDVDAAGAEKIVMDKVNAENTGSTLVEDATEQAIIPVPNVQERFECAWVVYTFNQSSGDSQQAYTAHYVAPDGEYLYCIPVSEPHSVEAATGQNSKTLFDFDAYESSEASVTVQRADGTTEEVTVPVLKDAESGKTYLADSKRQILCANAAPLLYNETMVPIELEGLDIADASVYYNYIRVWDFYDSIGWTGPDGMGTPTLLLMNFTDEQGEPVNNACYFTKKNGFQMFMWTRLQNYGACTDIVAHEFTHCLTGTTMTYNLYKNDPGAINEGYSDIMGNIAEMMLDGDAGAWTIAEGLGADKIVRNMADPHEFAQPEFAFDTYYAPLPPVTTGMNDKGGVHTNASMLSIVSYKLDQAGMSPRDQRYFWINSALVISPQTDYPMMAEILPWVMHQVGYDQYVDALKAAIEEAKFTTTKDPGTLAEGCGAATFDFASVKELSDAGRVKVAYLKAPDANFNKRVETWPVAGTTIAKASLPAGDYYVLAGVSDESGEVKKFGILTDEGWKAFDGKEPEEVKAAATKTVTVEAGKTVEVPIDGFGELATERLREIEQQLAEQAAAQGGAEGQTGQEGQASQEGQAA